MMFLLLLLPLLFEEAKFMTYEFFFVIALTQLYKNAFHVF
jgi:hypothetical protein